MASHDDVIEGLQILKKYATKDDRFGVEGQHDVIYAGPSLDKLKGKISDEDTRKLDELGWHQDEEGECWAKFT